MPLPYSGLKVLDLSQGIAGPYCAEILLQNGAIVTKVEPPAGDWSRGIGLAIDGLTALTVANNLGKRSISVDASNPGGRDLIRRLARDADILIESFRPGVMNRLGLSCESLSQSNPGLIYVSVTGFGPDGPYADRPASDSTLQALSGLMIANRDEHGNPRKVGFLVVDVMTGVFAAHATAAALYRRAIYGQGDHVHVSLLEAAAAMQGTSIVDRVLTGSKPARPVSVPAGTFRTRDGFVNVTSLHDKMFAGLCRATQKLEWLDDPRLVNGESRFAHAAEINAALEQTFRTMSTEYWLGVLRQNGVVCGPVHGYDEFLQDEQVRHAAIFDHIPQFADQDVPVPRVPGTSREVTLRVAPRAGADEAAVLADLGLTEADIAVLRESGALVSTRGDGAGQPDHTTEPA
ncbi:MAG: CoA transferase [Pseudomonadota bacterium]|jgi:crotonobetainyl-CoA:carnitine CoA-transferase CaiB-like acyl-CoA transferase|nr:CoA transferase [Pseudomonadota bacterium]